MPSKTYLAIPQGHHSNYHGYMNYIIKRVYATVG